MILSNTWEWRSPSILSRWYNCFTLQSHKLCTRWAPTSYKWSYNLYKWVTGVITLLMGVITPFITDRGPPCSNTVIPLVNPKNDVFCHYVTVDGRNPEPFKVGIFFLRCALSTMDIPVTTYPSPGIMILKVGGFRHSPSDNPTGHGTSTSVSSSHHGYWQITLSEIWWQSKTHL